METYPTSARIPHAPTEATDLYPESDGKPMAETDFHIQAIIRIRQILEAHFQDRLDVYISGNIMMYDIEGPERTGVSPDILVSLGIGQKLRRTYKVWEEGKSPDFVMELSSKGTFQNDLVEKVTLYAEMGIREYFLYDVDRRYLPEPLIGFRLSEGRYIEIPMNVDGGIPSLTLGVSFHLLDEGLGIYDVAAGQWLRTLAETATARAEQEAAARRQAEAETARLREEIERLKARL